MRPEIEDEKEEITRYMYIYTLQRCPEKENEKEFGERRNRKET